MILLLLGQNVSALPDENVDAERTYLDRTTWAPEVLAASYERAFIDLWDQLRRGKRASTSVGYV